MKESIEEVTGQYSKDQYAMYLRKSRADVELEAMGEGETLARHQKILENLAARHNISMNQVTIYREIVSGDSLDERPEAQRLLADVYAKKYKGVLVVEIERLARGNTKDQGEVADAFQYGQAHIITPAKVYDPNNEFDQEYFEFGLFMSRREYKTIKRRLQAGKIQSVKEGNYCPSLPPYGFDAVRVSKKERVLVEREDQSRIVKMIFDLYVNDKLSMYEIAHKLTTMGIKTPTGNQEWHRSTILAILTNQHYIGKVTWGNQTTIREKDPVTGKSRKKWVTTGNEVVYNGKHDGFIPLEQFETANKMAGTGAHTKASYEMVNPLSGLLCCPMCEKMFVFNGNFKKAAPRYAHKRAMLCNAKSIAADVVLEAIIESLKATIADYEIKLEAGDGQEEAKKRQAIIDTLQKELGKQEARKSKLLDSWESDEGLYTRDEFIERKQMYTQAIEQLKEQIAAAKKDSPASVDYEDKIVKLHSVIDCLQSAEVTAKEKNILLKKNIKVIYMQVEDLGRNRGGKPILDIHLL